MPREETRSYTYADHYELNTRLRGERYRSSWNSYYHKEYMRSCDRIFLVYLVVLQGLGLLLGLGLLAILPTVLALLAWATKIVAEIVFFLVTDGVWSLRRWLRGYN